MNYKDELKTKKKKKLKLKAFFVFFCIALLIAGVVYVIFVKKLFYIETIAVNATVSLSKSELETEIWRLLDGKFLGTTGNMDSDLMQTFPRIATVNIKRSGLHKLDIKITERQPVGIWCLQNCFYFDADGIAFAQIASTLGFLFVAIRDGRDRSLTLGDEVESDQWRSNIFEIKRIMQFGNLHIADILIPNDSQGDFTVRVNEGWSVFYDNSTNVGEQTNVLLTLIKEKITPEVRKNLEYIDLKLEDRIYYKER